MQVEVPCPLAVVDEAGRRDEADAGGRLKQCIEFAEGDRDVQKSRPVFIHFILILICSVSAGSQDILQDHRRLPRDRRKFARAADGER